MSKGLPKILNSFDFLKQLEKYCLNEDAKFIFRGTNNRYSIKNDGVNSGLYRWGANTVQSKGGGTAQFKLFNEYYQPPDMEKEIVEKARRFFTPTTSNCTILSDFQHLGGRTNLIDFSRNLYVSLFFACDGDFKKDAELILINTNKMELLKEIDYNNPPELAIIEPDVTELASQRVLLQHSVFVYAKKGYIESEKYTAIPVVNEFKKELLEYLRQIHNIYIDRIYNDFLGFVGKEQSYETAAFCFYKGNDQAYRGDYDSAIENYNRAIELKPDLITAYLMRGNAYTRKDEFDFAIADYSEAIKHKPDLAVAYVNRGNVYLAKDEYELAIADYNKAIDFEPNDAIAYFHRGNVYAEKGEYKLAIADYNKAIELKPNDEAVYFSRGIAYKEMAEYGSAIEDLTKVIGFLPYYATAYYTRGILFLIQQQWNKARSDLNRAQENRLDIIAEFKKEFGTTNSFEKKYEVKLPDDIAEMLGG